MALALSAKTDRCRSWYFNNSSIISLSSAKPILITIEWLSFCSGFALQNDGYSIVNKIPRSTSIYFQRHHFWHCWSVFSTYNAIVSQRWLSSPDHSAATTDAPASYAPSAMSRIMMWSFLMWTRSWVFSHSCSLRPFWCALTINVCSSGQKLLSLFEPLSKSW